MLDKGKVWHASAGDPADSGARRTFLKRTAALGGAATVAAAAGNLGFPFVRTARAETTTWKIQSA